MPTEIDRAPAKTPTGADRVLAALKELAHHPRGVSLDSLASALSSPKPSVHRALAALRRAGLAEQDARGSYRLGMELIRLANEYYEDLDLPRLVEPLLETLSHRFGETAHFAVLDGTEVVYLAKVSPRRGSVQMTSLVGGRNPAHCTGLGKALLAYALRSEDDVERFVREHGPLARRTPQTLTGAKELALELDLTRQRGYSIDREESELGVACIAFPLFIESATRPAGAISVATLVHRTSLESLVARADEVGRLIQAEFRAPATSLSP